MDWSAIKVPAPSWRSESGSFQREKHTLLRLRRRPGDRTALGAEAAYGLTSDQSTSVPSWVSIVSSVPVSPRLDFIKRRLGDRTTIDAEAVGGLTSDQSSSAIGYPSSQVCPLGRPHRRSDGYST
jgi:hypothetical protein